MHLRTVHKMVREELRDKINWAVIITLAEALEIRYNYGEVNHVYIQGDMYDGGEGFESYNWVADYTAWLNLENATHRAMWEITDYILDHGSCNVTLYCENWTTVPDEGNEGGYRSKKKLVYEIETNLTFEDMLDTYYSEVYY